MDEIVKDEIRKIIREVYTNSIELQECRFRGQHEANTEMLSYIPKDQIEGYVKHEMIKDLCIYIMMQKPNIIERKHLNGNKIFEKELMIFEPKQFVEIIIEFIRLIPKPIINKIKE